MFPDGSDLIWGSFLTQVSPADFASKNTAEERHHEPSGFLSGVFKGSQLRWPAVDREGFAIMSTSQRLEYLLWGGPNIYCDHRNMAYIFIPGALVAELSKKTAQRCLYWRTLSRMIPSTIITCQGLVLGDVPFQEVGQWGLTTL